MSFLVGKKVLVIGVVLLSSFGVVWFGASVNATSTNQKSTTTAVKIIKKRVVRRVVRPRVVTKKIKVIVPAVKAPRPTVVLLPSVSAATATTTTTTTPVPAPNTLTANDIIALSNNERAPAGHSALTMNQLLTQMAERKAQDILAKQYFEHVSPDGVGVGDLARAAGYDYALVGENLALGNFGSSQVVVNGWMNSPGHRANIMHKKFTEIGVAAISGTYEGRTVWVAVQEFGFPRAACPQPDENDKAQIAAIETDLHEREVVLRAKQQALNTAPSPAVYNLTVDEYNVLVRAYNDRVNELKGLVNSYNAAVDKMASCLK